MAEVVGLVTAAGVGTELMALEVCIKRRCSNTVKPSYFTHPVTLVLVCQLTRSYCTQRFILSKAVAVGQEVKEADGQAVAAVVGPQMKK